MLDSLNDLDALVLYSEYSIDSGGFTLAGYDVYCDGSTHLDRHVVT